jgi:hypothetical protein
MTTEPIACGVVPSRGLPGANLAPELLDGRLDSEGAID